MEATPHYCSQRSPRNVPSLLGSGGEGISLTSLLKVFWPSIRSPLPLPEFLSSGTSGDLSSLTGLLITGMQDLSMVPFGPVGCLVHFLSLEITCYFRGSFPVLKSSSSRLLCFAALTHVPPSSSSSSSSSPKFNQGLVRCCEVATVAVPG